MLQPIFRSLAITLLIATNLAAFASTISQRGCVLAMLGEEGLKRHYVWDAERDAKFVDLIIRNGIDFRPGDKVVIRADRDQYAMADVLGQELKKRGAAAVEQLFFPSIKEQRQAILNRVPPEIFAEQIYPAEIINRLTEQKFASIVIKGANEVDLPPDIDGKVWGQYSAALGPALRPFLSLIKAHAVPWTLAELPTFAKALRVSPDLPVEMVFEKYKELTALALQLDKADPAASWTKSNEELETRADKLNALAIRKLHYVGPGTDFYVELHERARWAGGRHRNHDRVTQANFPTYENFVTPVYKSAHGRLQVQLPVEVDKVMVEGAWFELKDGEVVKFGATQGSESLGRFLDQDPQNRNRRLGEIALVNANSPIAALGKIFYSTVYDENGASHVAFGSGYPSTFDDPQPATEEDFAAVGMNSPAASGHIDFMIGSPHLNITATTATGKDVVLMKNGQLVFEP